MTDQFSIENMKAELARALNKADEDAKTIAELRSCPKTIWCAANKVSSLYFECKDDANRYAGSFGATVNIRVFDIDVITNNKPNKIDFPILLQDEAE